MIVKELNCRE